MVLNNGDEALRKLEPPPGGVKRFEERLDRLDDSSRVRVGTTLAAGLAVALLGVVAVNIVRQPDIAAMPSVYQAPAFDRLLGRTMEEATLRVSVNDEPVSVSLVASADSNIRIYEIERE
jgi:hypothetical protein